MKAIRIIG